MKKYVFCPKCGDINPIERSHCKECGFEFARGTIETMPPTTGTMIFESVTPVTIGGADVLVELTAGEIAIYLVEAKKFIRFMYTKPILLGRGEQGHTSAIHFVNLEEYNAYARGMSRHHALIQRDDEDYYITDMNSSNGIVVDGKRLMPNRAYPLRNGAMVILGKFGIIFQYEQIAASDDT